LPTSVVASRKEKSNAALASRAGGPSEPYWRVKYRNFAELVQSVLQVAEKELQPTDRLFLSCLAAHSVKDNPHPGNERLTGACGLKTRQGVNKVADRIRKLKLAEVVDYANGGQGKSTVWRICVEDSRFPSPNSDGIPATQELQVMDGNTRNQPVAGNQPIPATGSLITRNSTPEYPQLEPTLPATPELHPNLDSEVKGRSSSEVPSYPSTVSSPNGSASVDDDPKFTRAKQEVVRSTPGRKDELAEGCDLIRERQERNGSDPVRNWGVYLKKGLDAFDDEDWKEVTERLAKRRKPKKHPIHSRLEMLYYEYGCCNGWGPGEYKLVVEKEFGWDARSPTGLDKIAALPESEWDRLKLRLKTRRTLDKGQASPKMVES
jgi:hypothetical protein